MAVARPAGPAPITRTSVSITPAGRGPLVSVRVVMAPESPRRHAPGSVARTDFIPVAAQAPAPQAPARVRSQDADAGGKPPAERQFLAAGTWQARAFAYHRARRRRLFLLTAYVAALIAVLIAAISTDTRPAPA